MATLIAEWCSINNLSPDDIHAKNKIKFGNRIFLNSMARVRLDRIDSADWMPTHRFGPIYKVTKTSTIRYVNINPLSEKFAWKLEVITQGDVIIYMREYQVPDNPYYQNMSSYALCTTADTNSSDDDFNCISSI